MELVLAVNRLRAQGMSLAAAIARARDTDDPSPLSLFAGLRRSHPEIAPLVMVKPTLLGLTRAVEDESRSQASGGLLIGGFQRERFYRQAEPRWRELAKATALAVALADFDRLGEPPGAPVEVPVPAGEPLSQEWFLIVDAPGASACLAGLERARQRPVRDSDRTFEVLWSMEPGVVRSAATLARRALEQQAPSVSGRLPPWRDDPPPATLGELRFATALANRALAYVTGERSG